MRCSRRVALEAIADVCPGHAPVCAPEQAAGQGGNQSPVRVEDRGHSDVIDAEIVREADIRRGPGRGAVPGYENTLRRTGVDHLFRPFGRDRNQHVHVDGPQP